MYLEAKNQYENPKRYLHIREDEIDNWNGGPGIRIQLLNNFWPEGAPRGGIVINKNDVKTLMWKFGNFMMEHSSKDELKDLHRRISRTLLEVS